MGLKMNRYGMVDTRSLPSAYKTGVRPGAFERRIGRGRTQGAGLEITDEINARTISFLMIGHHWICLAFATGNMGFSLQQKSNPDPLM